MVHKRRQQPRKSLIEWFWALHVKPNHGTKGSGRLKQAENYKQESWTRSTAEAHLLLHTPNLESKTMKWRRYCSAPAGIGETHTPQEQTVRGCITTLQPAGNHELGSTSSGAPISFPTKIPSKFPRGAGF